MVFVFCYKQKTAYEMRISDWSSDVCSADLVGKLATPQKSALGWHVIRVDEEQKKPARTLADVRDEISQQLAEEKSRKAFTDMAGNRSEERRVGKECVSPCIARWSPYH